MKPTTNRALVVSLLAVSSVLGASALCRASDRSPAALEMVTQLHPLEWAEAAVLTANGLVYSGDIRGEDGKDFRVTVYDSAQRKIIADLKIPHRAHYLATQADGSIAVTGKTNGTWRQHVTTIRRVGNTFKTSTVTIANEQLFEQIASVNGSLYASEPGKGTLLKVQNGRVSVVASGMSNPGAITVVNGQLALVEIASGAAGDENVTLIDPASGAKKSLWPAGKGKGRGMSAITAIPGTNLVAVNEWAANSVKIVDLATMTTVRDIPTESMPEGITSVGHCVAVASTESYTVGVYDMKTDDDAPVTTIDYSTQQDLLKSVRTMVSDPSAAGMTFYLRSTLPWSGGEWKTQSSVFRMDVTDQATLDRCLN